MGSSRATWPLFPSRPPSLRSPLHVLSGYATEKKSSIIAIGLTIHNTPVEIREKLAVPEAEVPRAIQELTLFPHVAEAGILSTCNRLEIYVVARSFHRVSLRGEGGRVVQAAWYGGMQAREGEAGARTESEEKERAVLFRPYPLFCSLFRPPPAACARHPRRARPPSRTKGLACPFFGALFLDRAQSWPGLAVARRKTEPPDPTLLPRRPSPPPTPHPPSFFFFFFLVSSPSSSPW